MPFYGLVAVSGLRWFTTKQPAQQRSSPFPRAGAGKALSRLGSEFAEKHQEVIEALTRGIVNKILHDPMVQAPGPAGH